MRDKINHLLRAEKRNTITQYFEQNRSNMKKIWNKINQIIHRQKSNSSGLCLNVDGNILSYSYEIGNRFNTFYTTVARKLVDKMNKPVTTYQD